ncbi:restriction endonuclease subunit S [Hyphomonas sp.]|uniref:restriction endonuclease subunit S n=1 Tax=Hyphomonas sp. TaxID=87 RepID=UPI003F712F30
MSGQEKTSTQAGEPIRAPRHFPGFEGDWARKELRPYLARHLERVPADTDLRIYSSSREGLLPQDEYYGGHNRINDGEYGVVPEGHFVYRHMSDDTTFKFNINNTGQPIAVSKEYPVFTTDGVDSTFLRYLLNESYPFKQFAAMQRKGGTRTRLYFEALCSWRAPLPSLPEQERIAECLASIDALIEAETEKLDALKDHKQGLMQQFFPAEGETLPALRFPEFSELDAWETCALDDLCAMRAGQFIRASEIQDAPANDLFPCYGGNGLRGYVETYTHEGRFPLIGRQGALCGNVKLAEGQFHATEHAIVATPKRSVDVDWLFYLLDFMQLNKHATGQAQPGLSVGALEQLPAWKPCEREQTQIASALRAADELIASQEAKVCSLQNHKQGLLQQLFPVLDEVDG